ncbi:uncharacterized protein LOC144923233 [Branchiostoma floridae x Branchiostoma belcheri]
MAAPTGDVPDNKQIYHVSRNAGENWLDLAWLLEFSDADIQGFDREKDLKKKCMKMLTAWRRRMGDDGTVSVLKEALVEAGVKNIADKLDFYRAQPSFPRVMNYSDNQQISEQQQQDQTEIQIGNTSQSGQPVNWQGRAEIAMAALQGKRVSGSTGVSNLPWPTTATPTSTRLDFGEGMLRFNPKIHGKQISFGSNGTVAQSHDSFTDGICFSSEPIKVHKKTNLKIIDSQVFHESMRFGFTCRNPDTLSVEELPPHSYPTLAQQPGPEFWVKPLPASLAHYGCVVTFTLEECGDVTFAADGEDKGLFFSGVDVSKPLWAVVDIHGSTVAVQFVGEEAASEAFDKRIHEGDQVQMWVEDMDTLRDMQDNRCEFSSDMEKAIQQVGIAVHVDKDENVHVFFPSINRRWAMSPAALRKVDRPDIRSTTIIGGDYVKVTADLEKLKKVQEEKHFWEDGMEKIPGKIGRAVGSAVGPHGELKVKVAGEKTDMMLFDPQVVQKTENQGDMCAQGLHHLTKGLSKVCVKCLQCTAKGKGCSMKGKPLRPPGSCCGCAKDDSGCADCGLCRSCAGEKSEEENMRSRVERLLRPLKGTLKDFVGLKAWLEELNLEEAEPNEHGLKRGDEVEVNVDKDTFQRLQLENGVPWNDDMVKVIGERGTIAGSLLGNHVAVQFQNDTMEIISSCCLTKVTCKTQDKQRALKEGDLVRLMKDENKLKMLQIGHGDYTDSMKYCLGKTGCVKKVVHTQKQHAVQVDFSFMPVPWWFNPKALTEVSSDEQVLQESVHQLNKGDCVKVAVDPETFSANQLGHGGPVDPVSRAMETAGVIHHFDIDGDAFICFKTGLRFLINPTSLVKVNPDDYQEEDSSELKEDEWVKIEADKVKIKQAQKETVPWNAGYYAAAGKIGVVRKKFSSDKILHVHIPSASATFPLNVSLVKRASLADIQKHFGQSRDSEFARGDLVKISVSLEELRNLQQGHGGYKPLMEKVMTEAGSVSFLDHEGDIHVRFGRERLCFNPSALTKVVPIEDKLYVGDLVQIESDPERLKTLQTPAEHGKYVEEMAMLCGKTGRLLNFVDSKKVRVKVQGRAWIFNPDLLRKIGNPRTAAADWRSATICARDKHNWSLGRRMVCVVCGECTEEGKLCNTRGRTSRIPGSVTGCGDGKAGCDDCGACSTCAGIEEEEDLLKSDRLQKVIKKTIEAKLKEEAEKRIAVDEAKTVVEKHRHSESGGQEEEGTQREKQLEMLALLDRMTQVIELIRKGNNSNEEMNNALIQHIKIPVFQTNLALKKRLGDHLANIGAAEVLMEYRSSLSAQANQCGGSEAEVLYECLSNVYAVINNCAHASDYFSHTLSRSGLLQMTVQDLACHYDMKKSDVNEGRMQQLVTTLRNCARMPENKDYLRDIGVLDLLKKHLSNENLYLKEVTLSCLARIVNDDELGTIQLQAEDTEFFMDTFKKAVDHDSHATDFAVMSMSAKDFISDLLALTRHDGNKHAFVEKGVISPLIQLIESGDDKEEECAVLCVQRFASVDSIRDTIVNETRVDEVLRALLTKDTAFAVQVAARKTLRCLGKEPAIS